MQISGKFRKFMPLFVTAILAAVIILPMWAGNTATSNNATEIKTLAELKAAFEAGGEYKLAADIEADSYIEASKALTLDLNGHKLSRTNITGKTRGDMDRYFVIVRDGAFVLRNSASGVGEIYARQAEGVEASPRAVAVFPKSSAVNTHPSITVGKGVKLTAEGKGADTASAHPLGIYTDYIKSSDNITNTATGVIEDGAIIDGSVIADGNSKGLLVEGLGAIVTVNGGEFKGVIDAVECEGGAKLVINGGSFSATKDAITALSGFVEINGGNFKATDRYAIRVTYDAEDYPYFYERGKVKVNSGTFDGGYKNYQAHLMIYGGKFSQNPSDYTVYNANVTGPVEGYYEVTNGTVAKDVTTFDELCEAGSRGGLAKLATDIEIPNNNYRMNAYRDLELDLNGHSIIKNDTESTVDSTMIHVKEGTLDLKNSAEAEGKITMTGSNSEVRYRPIIVVPAQEGEAISSATACNPKLTVGSGINISVSGGIEKSTAISSWTGVIDDPEKSDRTATVTISDGVKLSSTGRGMLFEGYGVTATINGGTVMAKAQNALSNDMGAVVTINDGIFESESRHCLGNCKATLKIYGGSFKAANAEKFVLYNDADQDKYYSATGDTTLKVANGVFTGGIKNITDETQGKATITIEQGVFTVDPTEYVAKSSAVTQVGETWVVKQTSGPSQPVIQGDVPENVDTNPDTEAVKEEDVPVVFTESVETLGDGLVYVKTDVAESIVAKAFVSEKITQVKPLPIFKATISEAGKIAAIATNIKGSDLLTIAEKVEDVDIRKLTSGSTALKFTRISNTEEAKDGTFIVLSSLGKVASGAIEANVVYQLVMFIQDNGGYDLDPTLGAIIDPSTLVKTESQSGGSSGGGGGCNAGFGALALLFAVPMLYRRKK